MTTKKFLLMSMLWATTMQTTSFTSLDSEDLAITEQGVYWTLTGGYCWLNALARIVTIISPKTEYAVLGMRPLSSEFKKRVSLLIKDLGITESLELRRFNQKSECGSPAAASTRCMYFEENACSELSDIELRAIIAHEYGHLKERHSVMTMWTFLALPFIAHGLIKGYLAASSLLLEKIPDTKYRWCAQFLHKPFEWLLNSGIGTCYVSTALAVWLSQHHEYQADRYAANMHPENAHGLITTFTRFAKQNKGNADTCSFTHPTLRNRITALGGTLELPCDSEKHVIALECFDALTSTMLSTGSTENITNVSHPEPVEGSDIITVH